MAAKPKKKASKTAAVSSEESKRKHTRFLVIVGTMERVATKAMLFATVFGCIYVGIYLPIRVSAGQETAITYLLAVVTSARLDITVSCALTGFAVWWAYRERRLRMRERRDKDARLAMYERSADPGRTSSELSVDGDTHLGGNDS